MPNVKQGAGYAGDVSVQDAWSTLLADSKAQLVDVRSSAEWTYVGVPDLTAIGRDVRLVEYQSFPSGAVDPDFAQKTARALLDAGAQKDDPVLFICRSGARSRAAATIMTQAGWTRAYNVAGGFEGDLDGQKHRGRHNGWKASELPWRQT
jgi:rhodanese-related sulfurtransferase